jgi:hypothetical protein
MDSCSGVRPRCSPLRPSRGRQGDPEKETVERYALAYVFHAGQVHQDEPAPVAAVG